MNRVVAWIGAAFVWLLLATSTAAQAGMRHYYYTDPQGTVLAKADAAGNIIEASDYRPYGTQVLGAARNGPGYSGHVNDADTGLVYMQARYYDPAAARFLSVDSVTPGPGNVFNFVRYVYGENNPIIKLDPDGRASVYTSKQQITIIQTFKNNGTQFSDQQIASQGQNLSGRASSGKMIVVILLPGEDDDAVKLNPNAKLNDLSKNGEERSHINHIGGRDVQVAPNAQGPGTVGHEVAHALKAGDQYAGGIDANGQKVIEDVPGPPNLMKNAIGDANQQTLDELEKGALSNQ